MDFNFVKLHPHSSNVVRIITPPYQYYSHFVNGKYKLCPQHLMNTCQECLKGKPKPKWFVGVIDRLNGGYSILNMNIVLFKKLQDIVRNPDNGDPKNYDIDITLNLNDVRSGQNSFSEMYDIVPGERYVETVDEEKVTALTFKIRRLTDPVCAELDKISSIEEFKNFYLLIHSDFFMVSLMTEVVPKWYPQYQETLQKLITFS